MADTNPNTPPTPPAKEKVVKLAGKNAPLALRTFEWCANKGDKKITFLRGKKVSKLPADLVDSYRKKGLIEPVPEKEEEEED